MGIYVLQSCPQRVPPMDRLRPPNVNPEGNMAGIRKSARPRIHILHPPSPDVHLELRTRGLGYT